MVKQLLAVFQHLDAQLGVFIAGAGRAAGAVERLFHRLQVGEHQLRVDGVDVAQRVDAAFDVHHVGIVEAPHDVKNRMDVANVRQKLVAQPLARRGAADQAGNVHKLKHRRHDFFGGDMPGDPLKARVGNRHGADVGFLGAKRVALGRHARGRQGVEQHALANVRESDDACFHESRNPQGRR